MNSNTAYLPAHTSGSIYLSRHHLLRNFHHRRSQNIAKKKNILHQVWFEVFTALLVKIRVFWDMTPCCLAVCWWRFKHTTSIFWVLKNEHVALNGKQQVQQCLQQANRRESIMGVCENGSMQPILPPCLPATDTVKPAGFLHNATNSPEKLTVLWLTWRQRQ